MRMAFLDIFRIKEYKETIEKLKAENLDLKSKYENEISVLNETLLNSQEEYKQLEASITPEMLNYKELLNNIERLESEAQQAKDNIECLHDKINDLNSTIEERQKSIEELATKKSDAQKEYNSISRRIASAKEKYKAVLNSIKVGRESMYGTGMSSDALNELDLLFPSIILKLHSMDVQSLKKAFKENDRQIESVMRTYSSRYTTKANQSIYQLMVIALRAELQNILYDLKYNKIDNAIDSVKDITKKYIEIACKGNQAIAPTLTRFIGEIEYFFINAVNIEYNYYIKREQARQEQAAIREQMRQEAEERKALENEKRKVEAEERKYTSQIEDLQRRIIESNDDSTELQKRIIELQQLLSQLESKKNDIINLQNGKAGNVYIISNYGSFGDSVFKIGMTRRLDPQERINELGSASVPFKFDVHSFIFSEDAVSLEAELHKQLDKQRVNKVNMRKEFFYSSIDELEALTHKIAPSAEFRRTMIAEEYNQSVSSDENYSSVLSYDVDENDD